MLAINILVLLNQSSNVKPVLAKNRVNITVAIFIGRLKSNRIIETGGKEVFNRGN